MGLRKPMDWDDIDVLASWAAEPRFYRAPHPSSHCPTPSSEREPLVAREYQHAAVEYAIARDHALLGDAPGLGKSPEAVMISNAIGSRSNLVVCPASLRLNWEREIWRWATTPNVTTYPIMSAKDGVSLESDWVIISYDLLRNEALFRALMSRDWDHLILDEAHAIKDPQGNRRTKAICGWLERTGGREVSHEGLADRAGRVTLASGTILPNQPVEAYNAIRLINWEAINCASLEDFKDEYYEQGGGFIHGRYLAKGENGDMVWKVGPHWSDEVRNKPRNLDDLRWRLRKYIMVRRLKEHVLTELPERQWHLVPLESTTPIRKALADDSWATVRHLYELDPDQFEEQPPVDGAISTAFRLLGEAAAPQVAAYARELILSGVAKLIIGAWHKTVLAYLREELKDLGVAFMDGSTSPAKKQKEVDKFTNSDKCSIMLGQILPLGQGWPLQVAQDVLQAEPWWVPGVNDQLLDRVHRFGQTGDYVMGHVPYVPGSLHETIIARAIKKDQHIYQALDARE